MSWPPSEHRLTALQHLPTCLVESVPNEIGDTEVCSLFHKHHGQHLFEYDLGLEPAPAPAQVGPPGSRGLRDRGTRWTIHDARSVYQADPWVRIDMAT